MDTIHEQMRSLRLPGMAAAWSTMMDTRTNTTLSLGDGLKLLLQAERDMRQRNRTARLMRNARFRYQASVEAIYFDADKGRDRDRVNALATCDFVRKGQSVMITGPSGTGKSYIASALGINACLAGFRVLYTGMAKLLERLQLARIDGSIATFFDRIAATELLIIDDFGMKKLDGRQLLDFMEIIEDRHGCNATIIASQLPVSDWYDVLEKNPTVADAILDRLVKTSHKIDLRGESYRK